ncbi:RluA family pseudouridine synthase [Bacillus sp. DJP31]|uniref:RluA family pseudouridine synthase n=1 Tax=Bacillus sp. DJP31 TaxID=3409789 RepID=UPI003BB6AA02
MQTMKKGKWLEIVTPSYWDGFTIETIVKAQIGVPKKLLHELRLENGIKLNNQVVPWQTVVKKMDRLYIKCFKEESFGVVPEDLSIEVLFEDDHLLIVNKPIMLDTHPNESDQTGTLANGVAYHWQLTGIQAKVRHIHRLDRETTGAIIFAKHALASALLDQMLEKREIKRSYTAFVEGILRSKKGTINESIGRDRHHPTRRRVSATGQKAITHYEVLRVFRQDQVTKIKLQLDTGRTHQIRVHLSHTGHPLLGDGLYGGTHSLIQHQALHAFSVSLKHPITKEDIHVEAPLPLDLFQLENNLK